MAKSVHTYRISEEVDTLIKAEVERLAGELGKKVSEADVIEMAVVAWLSGGERITEAGEGNTSDRRSVAEAAMRDVESRPTEILKVNKRTETVAQRKARETKEHITKLAECDTMARETGRDDIEYDPENTPYKSVLHVAAPVKAKPSQPQYDLKPKDCKPLTRPHGSTEAKRRREQ